MYVLLNVVNGCWEIRFVKTNLVVSTRFIGPSKTIEYPR